jgi:hypothetical protein
MQTEQRGAGLRDVEDSNWEPDGVTHHVRFCEGPGVTVGWLRSCGTAGKPGGNREDKHQPVPLGDPGLLTKSWPDPDSKEQRWSWVEPCDFIKGEIT